MVLPVLGLSILLAFDVLQTTLGSGGGPLIRRLTHQLWLGVLHLLRLRPNHTLFSFAGVFITLLTVTVWIVLWWLGWSLTFMGAYEAC